MSLNLSGSTGFMSDSSMQLKSTELFQIWHRIGFSFLSA
jgi:hypothetical protein